MNDGKSMLHQRDEPQKLRGEREACAVVVSHCCPFTQKQKERGGQGWSVSLDLCLEGLG